MNTFRLLKKSLNKPVKERTKRDIPSTPPSNIPMLFWLFENSVRNKMGVNAKQRTEARLRKNAPMLKNQRDEGKRSE